MKDFIAKAKAAGCDLIVFPELAIPGYLIGDIWDQPDYIDDCARFGEEIKALSDDIAIIFGNVAKETDRVNLDGRTRKYNAMFIAYNGRWISPARSPYPFYIKTLLPNYREFSDIRYFTSLIEVAQERHAFPEDFLSPVQIAFDDGRKFRMGPLICEDSWDENYPFKPMSYLGKMYDIDMFINISNSPFTLGKTQRRHRLFGQAIDKVHCPAIYVNCTGIQNNGKNIYTFDGASSTYQKDGSQHVECTPFTEEMTIVDFDETTQRFVSPAHLQPEKSQIDDIYASLHYGLKSFMDAIGVHKGVLGGHFQFIKKIHALVCHLKKNSRTHWSKIGFYLHQIAFGWICAVCGSCDGENTSRSARNVDRTVGTVKGIGISHLVHMSDNHNRTACIFRNRYQMIKLGSCFVGIVHRTTFSDIGTHRVKN